MNEKAVIEKAISEAIYFLNEESQSVIEEELAERYADIIAKLQKALIQLGAVNHDA